MIRKIKFQELPKDAFGLACMEFCQLLDSVMYSNRRYYEEFKWERNLKQLAFKQFMKRPLTNNIQHFGLKGSVGAGKSTTPIAFFYELMDAYPGIHILGMRRTFGQVLSSLFQQIRAFNERYGIEATYRESPPNPLITYKNGSQWVFWSSEAVLENKGSDTARGLGSTEYSGALIEEADMVHLAAVDTIPQRLREPSGVPIRLIAYVYNPTTDDHWIHKRFVTKETVDIQKRDDYNQLKFTMEDNAKNLPPGYIESMYAHYRNKPSLFRRMILGESGPIINGEPIYGQYFDRRIHVAKESFIHNWAQRKHWEDGPICLCFDFGYRHPAIFVIQDVRIGKFQQLRFLAAFKGDNITLKPFAKFHYDLLTPMFPNAEWKTFGDPAGENADARGVTAENAFDILRSIGLNPKSNKTREEAGVDLIIDLLQKIEPHKVLGPQPAIVVEPDTVYTQDIMDMLEIGFCQNRDAKKGQFSPVDDDNYIHLADAMRYGVTNLRSIRKPHGRDIGSSSGYQHSGDRQDYIPLTQNESGLWLPEDISLDDLQMGGW